MPKIFVRCYAELNNFLAPKQMSTTFEVQLPDYSSLETLANYIKLPIDEIDLILVNNISYNLNYLPKEGDRVAFYPVFETFDITNLSDLHERPLRRVKFVVDVHLGKLASHLRLLGFDTIYKNDFKTDELISISIEQKRILLSKCQSLINNPLITRAYRVKNVDPKLQLIETLDRFDLYNIAKPFTRCIKCNCILSSIEKEAIINRIPPVVREWHNEYLICSLCDRLYWKGSHYEYMNAFVQDVLRFRG